MNMSIGWKLAVGAAVLCLALAGAALYLCGPGLPAPDEIDVSSLLGGDAAHGFARATAVRDFHFPADHGPHPAYRTEWWYFTGNLYTESRRRFGYELSLFRFGLGADKVERSSAWAMDQVYMGHFAVTDEQGGAFIFDERLVRGALGLAGADADPVRIWVEDWMITAHGAVGERWQVRAATRDMAIELDLTALKPVILQGDRGLSQKSGEPGNASYYYSIPRLQTEGSVRVGGEDFAVAGLSWMDREWSTSALGKDQAGWDWFSLQLSNGYDLMYYQLRRKDGGVDAHSRGVLVDPDGRARALQREDLKIRVLDYWKSPLGGTYPGSWRLGVDDGSLELEITPVLADQELDVSVRYWEGAVDVTGTHGNQTVTGAGYVELVGYSAR